MSGKVSGICGKIMAVGIVLAMLFSSGFAFAETAAEPPMLAGDSSPPYPPFMLWGMVYGEDNMPVLDTTVTITNLMTGESLIADVYGNGAYDAELEDMLQGYSIGDEIEIRATSGDRTASKTLLVKQRGFGELVDILFGDGKIISQQ